MQYKATSAEDYISQVPQERQNTLKRLRKTIVDNLPKGFEEGIQYGMIGYYVPHSIYPDGYHCTPMQKKNYTIGLAMNTLSIVLVN